MDTKGRYGYFKKTVSSFVFFTVLLFSAFCSAKELSRVDLLVEQAVEDKLHEDDYWLILLHYKKGVSGIKSLFDDPEFFLSKNGKRDPLSELEATIRSFFQEDKKKAKETLCRFSARYFWLKDKLEFDKPALCLSPEKTHYLYFCQFLLRIQSQYPSGLVYALFQDGTEHQYLSYMIQHY